MKNTGRLVHDIATYSRFCKQPDAFYSYSTAVFPEQQGKGVATHLKRSQIAHARAEGFRYLTGHAREGAMMHLAEKMGAKIVKEYPNWYDTGATNYLYEIDMDGINVDRKSVV